MTCELVRCAVDLIVNYNHEHTITTATNYHYYNYTIIYYLN